MAKTKRRKRGKRPEWLQVISAKRVQAPIELESGKTIFMMIGVRIIMQDDTSYFWAKRFDTWTKTELGRVNHYRSGEICSRLGDETIGPDRKTSMGTTKVMMRDYSHCPKLVKALLFFRQQALSKKKSK